MSDNDQSEKRQILRSTSIIGGATVGGLAIGLIKMKVIAAVLGTTGVGLIGMLNALMAMGVSIAGMGLETSAVRQLSASAEDPEKSRIVRWALWTYAWPLAILGSAVVWLFRTPLAKLAMGSSDYAPWVGWIALGVGASVIGAAQVALVQSHRRMGDLARIRLAGALAAAIVGVAAILAWGMGGIVAAVLATPLATCLAALWYGRALPSWQPGSFPRREVVPEWRTFAGLGTTVMLATVIGSITQAAVRSILAQKLGLDAAGLFQASYAISSLNLGIVLGAMVPDYYPRLSAAADDEPAVESIFNQQVHVGIVIAAPALTAISAAAPFLLSILYTSEFTQAALLLRLQVTADALRIAGWALGFVLLARKARLSYFLVEGALSAVFLPLTWFLAPRFGVAATGAAYLAGYFASLAVALAFASFSHKVRLGRANILALAGLVLLLLSLAGISILSESMALAAGAVALTGVGYWSLREIARIGVPIAPTPIMNFIRKKFGGKRGAA